MAEVIGTKEEYIPDEAAFDTYGRTESGTIIKKLYLTPEIDVIGKSYDKVSGAPLLGTTIELVAVPDSKVLGTKQDDAKYRQEYDLEFKQRYWLIASKEGYIPDTVEVFTDDIAVVPTHLERDLFLCRRPFDTNPHIVLYFDNDIPGSIQTFIIKYIFFAGCCQGIYVHSCISCRDKCNTAICRKRKFRIKICT